MGFNVRQLIHIVDDGQVTRAWASYLLTEHGYSTEIYEGGAEFFRNGNLERGCILLDLAMPEMSGYEVLEEFARRGNVLQVVVMSSFNDPSSVVRAMKLGAADYIEKPANEESLLAAVDKAFAASGKNLARRNVTAAAAARLSGLTPRELQTLQGLLDGLTNKGIARRLGLSPRTVEMHRSSMKIVLGVTSISEAVQFAIDAEMTPRTEGAFDPISIAG